MGSKGGMVDPPAEVLAEAAAMFGLLASPPRLHIVWALAQGESDVSGLAERVGGALPAVSQHLTKLKLAGLVRSRREGRRVVYLVDDPDVVAVVRLLVVQLADRAGHPAAAPSVTSVPETTAVPGTGRTPSGIRDVPAGHAPPDGSGGGEPAALTTLQLLRLLGSGPRGLTEEQAGDLLVRHGENTVPAWRPVSWPRRFLGSLRDPFTTVLLCLGLVSAAVASWGTACVIMVLVVVSCVLRSGGEHHASRSMAALRELVATTASVQRRADDAAPPQTREIPVDQLVVGDVVRLGPGDLVPADLRLLRASGLTVHQAALTGESAPVAKYAVDAPSDESAGLPEPPHMCFQGSSVASGSGTALVVATGADTRFAAYRPPRRRAQSAFDRSVHGIAWTLIRFMLIMPPLVLMADGALRGRGLETLPFAVAVAVGLTPEMLPVIVTAALARGPPPSPVPAA